MKATNGHRKLIADALHGRRLHRDGCFVSNQAADELEDFGLKVLPDVEQVLCTEVLSVVPMNDEQEHREFRGLGDLVVTYFRIAKQGGMGRGAKFLEMARGNVWAWALRAIAIIWDHVIPHPFVQTIETRAKVGTPEEQDIARWLLNWHYNRLQVEKSLAKGDKGIEKALANGHPARPRARTKRGSRKAVAQRA